MALTATLYNFTVELSDVDRGVYETLEIRMAQQPSETAEYMLARLFAYCLEYCEGIELTEGVAAGDEPAVLVRDLTGRVTAWIEVGMPDDERLHRGSKLAGRAAVYTHRDPRQLREQFAGKKIHRSEEIPIYVLDRALIDELVGLLERRMRIGLSVTEGQLYLDVRGKALYGAVGKLKIEN